MPQIIKHRRGPIATLKAITPYRGEVVFTTSSLGDIIGPNLHIGDGTQQGGFLVNRLQYGATPPALAGVNTVMNDIPFYDTDDKILYRLNSGGHVNLDLTGNIKDRTIAGTLDITGRLDAQADLQVTGSAYISENIQLDDNKYVGIDSDTNLMQLKDQEVKVNGMLSASSDIWIGGNLVTVGNGTFGGNLTFGDATTDTVSFGADITSNLIPDVHDSYDLGSTGQRWNNLWLSGSITADGGPHSLTSLSTIDIDAEGALTIDGGSITIGGDADVATVIESSTLDVNAAGAVTIDSGAGVSIDAAAASNLSTSAGALTIDGAGGINIGTAGNVAVDFNAAAFDLDAAGALTIDSATSIAIGTAADKPIDIDATTFDLDAAGALTIDSGTSISIGTAADKPIDIDATTFDLDATGLISLDSSGGSIDMNVVDGQTVSIGLNGAVETIWSPHNTAGSELWSTINTAGTTDGTDGAGAILLSSVAGGIGLAWADGKDLWAEGGRFVVTANENAAEAIKLHADAGAAQTIHIVNDAGTAANAIDIDATAGGIDIDASGVLALDGAGGINIGTTADVAIDIESSTLDIDASGAVDIDSTARISLGAGAASDLTTSAGAITIDGNAGISLKEAGTDVIAIDTARDVLFSRTGGSSADPDVEFDGYVRFDGTTEFDGAVDFDSTIDVAGLTDFQNNVHVQGNLEVTGSTYVQGNLEVLGTTTTVDSTTVQIGDNIIELNTAAAAQDGGIHVYDTSVAETTGSIIWSRTGDYWRGGLSGSEYRLPEQAALGNLTENKPVIVDANGRLESSANITDDGTDIDFNDKDLTSVNKLEGVDANTFVDLGDSGKVVTKGGVQPSAHNADDLGITGTRYKNLWLQGNADLEGDIDVNGTSNLDNIDVDGTFDFASTGTFNAATTFAAASDMTLAFSNGTNAPQMMWRNPSDAVRFVATPPDEDLNGDPAAHSSGSLLLYDGVDGFYHTRIIDGGQF